MNSDIHKIMRQRHRLKRVWKQSNHELFYTEFSKCKNPVLSICPKADENTKNLEISQTNTTSKKW